MYTLYGGGFSRANLSEMVMTEVGVPYQVEHVDILKGGHKTPEFLEVNPAGWVPALRTKEGVVLYETPAINMYFAERYGDGVLAPATTAPERGLFLSGLFYLTDELEPALKRYFYPHRYTVREDDETTVQQSARDAVNTCLKVINQRLEAHGPYHLGGRYSLVDLTLTYWMKSLPDDETLSHFDALHRCTNKVVERTTLSALFKAHEQLMIEYAALEANGGRAR